MVLIAGAAYHMLQLPLPRIGSHARSTSSRAPATTAAPPMLQVPARNGRRHTSTRPTRSRAPATTATERRSETLPLYEEAPGFRPGHCNTSRRPRRTASCEWTSGSPGLRSPKCTGTGTRRGDGGETHEWSTCTERARTGGRLQCPKSS